MIDVNGPQAQYDAEERRQSMNTQKMLFKKSLEITL